MMISYSRCFTFKQTSGSTPTGAQVVYELRPLGLLHIFRANQH
jgi:hypothetical protein